MTEAAAHDDKRPGPVGLGGWLVLPILGFVVTIPTTVAELVDSAVLHAEGLRAILTETSGMWALLKVLVLLSLALGGLIIVTASWCLYQVFARRHAIVRVATAHYLILVVRSFVDLWLANNDPRFTIAVLGSVVGAAIWIPYFQVSKRVENTFVEGRGAAALTAVFD